MFGKPVSRQMELADEGPGSSSTCLIPPVDDGVGA